MPVHCEQEPSARKLSSPLQMKQLDVEVRPSSHPQVVVVSALRFPSACCHPLRNGTSLRWIKVKTTRFITKKLQQRRVGGDDKEEQHNCNGRFRFQLRGPKSMKNGTKILLCVMVASVVSVACVFYKSPAQFSMWPCAAPTEVRNVKSIQRISWLNWTDSPSTVTLSRSFLMTSTDLLLLRSCILYAYAISESV